MGRSAPTLRVAVRRELERIKRISRVERDPEIRRSLEEVLRVGEKLLDAYSIEPPADAMEVVLLSAIVELFSRCGGRSVNEMSQTSQTTE